jgi:membrane-associated phospholipid phosphatase
MKLSAVDNLSLLFLAGLTVLALVYCDSGASLLAVQLTLFVFLAVLIISTSWWEGRSALGEAAHAFLPALSIPVLFNTLGPIIDGVNPRRWDDTFAALDARLFGETDAIWRDAFGRPSWLTDLAYLLYVGYYFLPVVLAVMLYQQRRRADFDEFVLNIVVCFYLLYVGYLLWPTCGPRLSVKDELMVLGGGSVSVALRAFIQYAERTTTDAFPSGHTAVALVCLFLGWRMLPLWQLPLSLAVFGIIFSTVYLHYHYLIDIVAGAALAAVALACARIVRRIPEPHLVHRWVAQILSEER